MLLKFIGTFVDLFDQIRPWCWEAILTCVNGQSTSWKLNLFDWFGPSAVDEWDAAMTSAIRWPFGVSASSVSGGQIGHWPMIDQPLHLEGENEQSGMGQLPFILKRFHSNDEF